jgi:hypothetical protein
VLEPTPLSTDLSQFCKSIFLGKKEKHVVENGENHAKEQNKSF